MVQAGYGVQIDRGDCWSCSGMTVGGDTDNLGSKPLLREQAWRLLRTAGRRVTRRSAICRASVRRRRSEWALHFLRSGLLPDFSGSKLTFAGFLLGFLALVVVSCLGAHFGGAEREPPVEGPSHEVLTFVVDERTLLWQRASAYRVHSWAVKVMLSQHAISWDNTLSVRCSVTGNPC